jgi:L-rhamnose mutarotase
MRAGSLIKLKPEYEERYIILHKHTFPGVLERIRKSNIRDYSIFLQEGMLFSYMEYVGDDYDGDMAEIGRDEVTQEWWKLTDPMQEPLKTRKEGEWWTSMDEIFHWSAKNASSGKSRRMAFTARILDGVEEKVMESLKIAYPILVETADLKNIKNFSIFHQVGSLYSYFEHRGGGSEEDIQKLLSSLRVEDELFWQPMKEVFHTD